MTITKIQVTWCLALGLPHPRAEREKISSLKPQLCLLLYEFQKTQTEPKAPAMGLRVIISRSFLELSRKRHSLGADWDLKNLGASRIMVLIYWLPKSNPQGPLKGGKKEPTQKCCLLTSTVYHRLHSSFYISNCLPPLSHTHIHTRNKFNNIFSTK